MQVDTRKGRVRTGRVQTGRKQTVDTRVRTGRVDPRTGKGTWKAPSKASRRKARARNAEETYAAFERKVEKLYDGCGELPYKQQVGLTAATAARLRCPAALLHGCDALLPCCTTALLQLLAVHADHVQVAARAVRSSQARVRQDQAARGQGDERAVRGRRGSGGSAAFVYHLC
jgi:hypothetical protein